MAGAWKQVPFSIDFSVYSDIVGVLGIKVA
jgi:hypothetical protein